MSSTADPFRHHPELREKIGDPMQSQLRSIDVDDLDRQVRAAGLPDDWRHSHEYNEETRQTALARRGDDDLWVFAYGSLMWDPAIHFSEVRSGSVSGHHRSFCLKTVLGRGTPDNPGLMAGLDQGGACRGLAFRIPEAIVDEETQVLWRREMLLPAYLPEFVSVETAHGTLEAVTFVIDQNSLNYVPGLSMDETARMIASGEGVLGTSLAYVENLAEHFTALGIEDAYVFDVLERCRRLKG